LYAQSKSLGESEECMVLRTSIIGEEIHNNQNLIEWCKSQKGKNVEGYNNHLWNGMTTKELARIFIKIINEDFWAKGIYHVFSPDTISKYELLKLINTRYKLKLKIREVENVSRVNRALCTDKDLNEKLEVRRIKRQIKEL